MTALGPNVQPLRAAAVSILTAVALAGCASTSARPPASGTYSNVQWIEEAGDLVGLRLTLHGDPPTEVDYELCEGECGYVLRLPVTVHGRELRFTVVQPVSNGDGTPAEPSGYRLAVRERRGVFGRTLVVTSPDLSFREVLKPSQTSRD